MSENVLKVLNIRNKFILHLFMSTNLLCVLKCPIYREEIL